MEHGLEITSMNESGYRPLVSYEAWRVAVLAYCDDVRPEAIRTAQRHDLTDEVFVLLRGNCMLFTAGAGDKPGEMHAERMEPGKVYNVKKGLWHNHVLDENGAVLIVENDDTTDGAPPEGNSPILPLSDEQRRFVLESAVF